MSEDIVTTTQMSIPYIIGVLTTYPENSTLSSKVRVRPLVITQIYMLSSRKSFYVRQVPKYTVIVKTTLI